MFLSRSIQTGQQVCSTLDITHNGLRHVAAHLMISNDLIPTSSLQSKTRYMTWLLRFEICDQRPKDQEVVGMNACHSTFMY